MGWPRELTVVRRSVFAREIIGYFSSEALLPSAGLPSAGADKAAGKVERVAPRDNLRFFAGIGGGDGKVEDAAGAGRGEERHFALELEMMAHGEPGTEPGAADEAV